MLNYGEQECLKEFLHVDDLVNACVHFMHNYNENSPVNIGTGKDIAISDGLFNQRYCWLFWWD